MSTTAVQLLAERLGLSDEEVLEVLDADPLAVIGGELEHKPQLRLLLALTEEPAEQVGVPTLRRWLRTAGPSGRPIDLLVGRDFGAFEDALATLQARGLVIRRAD
ncbi:hypothetical protein PAI11_33510 [Patulibacter medicamentivorans]|uniref:Uncharacterized protein n=1 Tax=Patulibacter medicamentivorans TaxID=1097667 RepID=H0E936_9ACTN|nr:hypothetical protein [Patulibacter medicamentivorans]EHN09814.1 hypothetical protein PAI11_33510 [Patulibacter medicamentivorans]